MSNSMGSLFIGASGLQTSQHAMNTTANNLANVDTKGYVREQVLQTDRNYYTFSTTAAISRQQSGLGVTIGDVIHARDIFLDKAYRTQYGREAYYSATYEAIAEVETLFQEMEGTAFEEVLTGDSSLRTAFEEFSKNPSDSVYQNLVVQKANLFISRAQGVYSGLTSYQNNINVQISDDIKRINELGDMIQDLNVRIMTIEAGGIETAMAYRDERDNALDELAKYGTIEYKEAYNGVVKVKFEGVSFVDEKRVYHICEKKDKINGFITPYWGHLSDTDAGEYYAVYDPGEDICLENKNDIGELKALVLSRGYKHANYTDLEGVSIEQYDETLGNSVMMNSQAELDELVHQIVKQINDIFCPNKELTMTLTGVDAQGKTVRFAPGTKILDTDKACVGSDGKLPPQELFVRTGCERYQTITGDDGKTYYVYNEEDLTDTSTMYTINSLIINKNLMENETLLPAYTQNGAVAYKMGESLKEIWSVQSTILNPRDTTPCTFSELYNKFTGELATLGDIYNTASSGLSETVLTTDNARQQVVGVSSDEELTKMIKYQSAYNAASRYITVISEMIETIVTQLG